MTTQNEPAFATSSIDGYNSYKQIGLTKLEYFSIECLKKVISSTYISDEAYNKILIKSSISIAKELLKQLEDEN